MNHLFATTDLERSYRVNLNLIGLDGRLESWGCGKSCLIGLCGAVPPLADVCIDFDKVLDRLHVLDGLMIAFLNIDEVIQIIREEEDPKQALMDRFGLSTVQADAILDLKLRHLAKLEEMKIKSEQSELDDERSRNKRCSSSERRLTTLMKKELLACAETYGDERRCPMVERSEARAPKSRT